MQIIYCCIFAEIERTLFCETILKALYIIKITRFHNESLHYVKLNSNVALPWNKKFVCKKTKTRRETCINLSAFKNKKSRLIKKLRLNVLMIIKNNVSLVILYL